MEEKQYSEKQLNILLESSKQKNRCRDWNEWRRRNPETPIQLKGAPLTGIHLIGTDLSGVDLSGGDLSGAFLCKADLRGARLEGTDFNDSYLEGIKIDKTTSAKGIICSKLFLGTPDKFKAMTFHSEEDLELLIEVLEGGEEEEKTEPVEEAPYIAEDPILSILGMVKLLFFILAGVYFSLKHFIGPDKALIVSWMIVIAILSLLLRGGYQRAKKRRETGEEAMLKGRFQHNEYTASRKFSPGTILEGEAALKEGRYYYKAGSTEMGLILFLAVLLVSGFIFLLYHAFLNIFLGRELGKPLFPFCYIP